MENNRVVITQICRAGTEDDIIAIDSRGRAWILNEDESGKRWEPLPEVPQADLREVKP